MLVARDSIRHATTGARAELAGAVRAGRGGLLDHLHRVPGFDDLDVDEVEHVLGTDEVGEQVAAVVADPGRRARLEALTQHPAVDVAIGRAVRPRVVGQRGLARRPHAEARQRVVGGGGERQLHALRGESGAVHRHVEVRRGDRRGRRGVDDRPGRAHGHDGSVDALAERQVLTEEVADVGNHLAVHDEGLRVDEVRHLRGRAGEVEVQRAAIHGERARQFVLLDAPLDPAGHRVGAMGEAGDAVAQHRLGGVAHRGEGVRELAHTDGLHDRRKLRGRHVAPGNEPAQVHLHQAG